MALFLNLYANIEFKSIFAKKNKNPDGIRTDDRLLLRLLWCHDKSAIKQQI
jgi:hypothetical protein